MIFDFIKRKKMNSDRKILNQNLYFGNTIKISPKLDPRLTEIWESAFWNECVLGLNKSTSAFSNYKKFISDISLVYKNIDFERIIYTINGAMSSIHLTVGEVMYLLLLDLDQDSIYHNKEIEICKNINNIGLLTYNSFETIFDSLTENEKEYYFQIKNYIKNNIYNYFKDTQESFLGFSSCKLLPINTVNCINYHKWLFEETEQDDKNIDISNEYNLIKNAPLCSKISTKNPLIPIDIRYLDVFILDYLCYASMVHPTRNYFVIMNCKLDNGKTLFNVLKESYGETLDLSFTKIIQDMNGKTFRDIVRYRLIVV